VFAGVPELPTREKSAIQPWHTLHAEFYTAGFISTVAGDDPMHSPIGNA
jgi:hypothetical protein